MKHSCIILALILIANILIAVPSHAQEHNSHSAEAVAAEGDVAAGIKFIAAALAVGLCALGTAYAQSRIGAAGVGAIVEKPDSTGAVIILLAIPETIVILGFVVAAMIITL